MKSFPGSGALHLCVALVLLFGGPAASIAAEGDAPPSENRRRDDAETVRALSAEGQILYERDRVKLDGYQYCGQSVGLAERGEFRSSIRSAAKALHLGMAQGNDDLLAVAKRDLAIAYNYAGDYKNARTLALEALEHEARDPKLIQGPALKIVGDAYAREGRWGEAVSHYRRALSASSDRFRPLVQVSLANALVSAGDAPGARALYGDLAKIDHPVVRGAYQRGFGNLLLAEDKPADALKVFEASLAAATGNDAEYHRLWAFDGMARARLGVKDRAGARRALAGAAQVSDSIRARFRSEELKTGLFGDVQSIFERAIALAAEDGDVEEAWRLSEQSRARALLDVVRGRVTLDRSGDTRQLGSGPLTLAETKEALRANEVIVSFHSLPDRLLVWVIRRNGITGGVVAMSRAETEVAVQAFRTGAADPRGNVNAIARSLHAKLIEPLGLVAGERLLIVPHDKLHYLPFQALRGPDGYLIERHPIAVTPSSSVAIQLVRRSRPMIEKLVAFGNPELSEAHANLPSLEGAEQEVGEISKHFVDPTVFLGRSASKRRFRELASTARVLHIAAHAVVDEIDPLLSRILLAPGDGDTGALEAREVYELDFSGVSLVALSACETGLGRVARGDEILGFTRSFFTAGAAGLLVSLWEVADDSTALLMTTFYRELAAGSEAIDAMQRAQVSLLKRAKFSRPFYWAPFNLMGDWRLRTRPP